MGPITLRSLLVARGPEPEALAAIAATSLLMIITNVGTPRDWGMSAAFVEQAETLIGAVILVTALAHGAVLALAARLRSHLLSLPVLLLGTAALPPIANKLRPVLHVLLMHALPTMCGEAPDFCPPHPWSPELGLALGLGLAPFAVAAVHVREQRAHDDRTRMAWITGALVVVAGGALMLLGAVAYRAGPLTCLLGLAFMSAAALDTRRRHAFLVASLREGRARIVAPSPDDPENLRPFCTLASGRACDGVLQVLERWDDGPYREAARWTAVAVLPRELEVTTHALQRRSERQRLGLALAAVITVPVVGVSAVLGAA